MRCSGPRENSLDEPHGECEVYGFYLKITTFINHKTSISLLRMFSF